MVLPVRASKALRPWLMGIAAFWLALLWLVVLIGFAAQRPALSPLAAILGALVWAAGTGLLVLHWATGADFGDRHRLAIVFGALVASWLQGFIIVASGPAIDILGKLVLDLVGIALLAVLALRVRRRLRSAEPARPGQVRVP